MVFNFTFHFTGGLSNPFSSVVTDGGARRAAAESDSSVARGARESDERSVRARILKQRPQQPQQIQQPQYQYQQHQHQQRRLLPPPPRSANLPSITSGSRKRGWEPAFAEPSQPTTSSAMSPGHLNTPPSKYRESATMASNESHDEHESQSEEPRMDILPAAKRRRTLAGSIITTALSAALIGTAVGLTMYRLCVLWADRGHADHHERLLPPPPSYQEATAATNNNEARPGTPSKSAKTQPSTPRHRKPVRLRGNLARKNARHARPLHYSHHDRHGSTSSAGPATPTSSVQPEFDFAAMRFENSIGDDDDDRMEEDEEMSVFSDRISALISEGKRALGREVVVSSERPEDELDDGAGDWVEDDGSSSPSAVPHPFPLPSMSAISRSKRRPSSLSAAQAVAAGFLPAHRATLSAAGSPRRSRIDGLGGRRSLGGAFERTDSVDSARSTREDAQEWESPELREFMRKARESRGLA